MPDGVKKSTGALRSIGAGTKKFIGAALAAGIAGALKSELEPAEGGLPLGLNTST